MNGRSTRFAVRSMAMIPACCAGWAQTPTGQITGLVTDATGAVIQGAGVTATQVGTGTSRETRSNQSRNYTIPLLPPGSYRIVVESPGFKQVTRTESRARRGPDDTAELREGYFLVKAIF